MTTRPRPVPRVVHVISIAPLNGALVVVNASPSTCVVDEVSPEPWSWPEWSADAAADEIYSSKLTPMIGSRAIEVGARSEST